jgi:hypothetical protein
MGHPAQFETEPLVFLIQTSLGGAKLSFNCLRCRAADSARPAYSPVVFYPAPELARQPEPTIFEGQIRQPPNGTAFSNHHPQFSYPWITQGKGHLERRISLGLVLSSQ